MDTRVLVVLGNHLLHGQERANVEVYRALAADGVDALFATNAAWGAEHVQPHLDALGLQWAEVPYARHFARSHTPGQTARNAAAVLRGSRRFLEVARAFRPTHIHVANPHYVLAVLPALLALRRVPLVYRAGDTPTLHHALYRTLLRRFIIPRTRVFVCDSAHIRDAWYAAGVPASKLRVVMPPPPARPPRPASDLPPELQASGADRNPAGRVVAFVGQVSPHKGVHHLVDAVSLLADRHPGLRLVVAGHPVSDDYLADLRRRAGRGAEVIFPGYVEDVDGVLAAADVHAAPSQCEEALGLVVLEAKRAGTPSVVFPDGGLPELVTEPGVDGLVCADQTPAALADALDHYLSMSDDALARAGGVARASLQALGADEPTFRRAWRDALDAAR